MKNALKWVAGVFCFVGSFSALIQGAADSFVLLLLAALVTTPPTLHLIEAWLGIKFQRPYRYLLSGGLFVLGAVNMPGTPEESPAPESIKTVCDTVYIVRVDTVTVHDTVFQAATSSRKTRRSETTTSNQIAPVEYYSSPSPAPKKRTVRKSVSSGNGYIRGPRGGCYYYNSSGRKVYVDRSLCD